MLHRLLRLLLLQLLLGLLLARTGLLGLWLGGIGADVSIVCRVVLSLLLGLSVLALRTRPAVQVVITLVWSTITSWRAVVTGPEVWDLATHLLLLRLQGHLGRHCCGGCSGRRR